MVNALSSSGPLESLLSAPAPELDTVSYLGAKAVDLLTPNIVHTSYRKMNEACTALLDLPITDSHYLETDIGDRLRAVGFAKYLAPPVIGDEVPVERSFHFHIEAQLSFNVTEYSNGNIKIDRHHQKHQFVGYEWGPAKEPAVVKYTYAEVTFRSEKIKERKMTAREMANLAKLMQSIYAAVPVVLEYKQDVDHDDK